jgi:hypothetical protein
VCAGAVTSELLHLPSIPTNNVILCDNPAEASNWPVGSFRLTLCHRCGFVFNSDFDPRLVEYSARIEETQAYSAHFVGMQNPWRESGSTVSTFGAKPCSRSVVARPSFFR